MSTSRVRFSTYARARCTQLTVFNAFSVNTTPNPTHTSHSRTRDFSRVAQDLRHRVNRNCCVSQNSSSSHLAQHVSHALVVASVTLEHYLTLHMHSSPTFHPTIYPTFVAVHFTRRCTLRGSVECVFRPLKRSPLHSSNRCSSTDRV